MKVFLFAFFQKHLKNIHSNFEQHFIKDVTLIVLDSVAFGFYNNSCNTFQLWSIYAAECINNVGLYIAQIISKYGKQCTVGFCFVSRKLPQFETQEDEKLVGLKKFPLKKSVIELMFKLFKIQQNYGNSLTSLHILLQVFSPCLFHSFWIFVAVTK